MDSQQRSSEQAQQQKDFFASLFTPDENLQRENYQQAMYPSAMPTPSQPSMAGSNQGIANIPLNFDFLGGLMGIQGGGQSTAPLQTQFNPEQLLKQRLQLNQLQQLQLQNQIIQQQVSSYQFRLFRDSRGPPGVAL